MPRVLRLGQLLLIGLAFTAFSAGQSDTQDPSGASNLTHPVSAPAVPLKTKTPAAIPPAEAVADPKPALPSLVPDPIANALSLYRKKNFPAAVEMYKRILQEDPNSPDASAGLARVYLRQRNVGLASETVLHGLTLSDAPRLHVVLAEVYFRQGRISEAEHEWVRVLNSGTSDARAYLGVAHVRNAISMYKSGKAMIDKAHQLDPADPDIEDYWIDTLPTRERIRYLENYLSTPSEDGEDRADAQRYLDSLKALVQQPKRSCHLVNHVTSTETPLVRLLEDPTHLRGYGLTVVVNGHKTKLMLDTGASGILIDRGIAEKAGIVKLSETRIGGIGDKGYKSGYVGLAGSIKIGELEFQDCTVGILDNRSVVGEEGLIGADVFQDFLVNIDFPKEKLRLSELPKRPEDVGPPLPVTLRSEEGSSDSDDADGALESGATKSSAPVVSRFHDLYIAPEMKSYTRVYRIGHDLLVPTKVGNAPIKLFLLDTGALLNQITPAAAREVTKVHGDSDMIVKGISGSVKNVYSADKAILQFGHLRQENQDIMAFDLSSISDSAGTEISGTLGFAMLHLLNIKIDYRDGLVDFEYKP